MSKIPSADEARVLTRRNREKIGDLEKSELDPLDIELEKLGSQYLPYWDKVFEDTINLAIEQGKLFADIDLYSHQHIGIGFPETITFWEKRIPSKMFVSKYIEPYYYNKMTIAGYAVSLYSEDSTGKFGYINEMRIDWS